MKEGNAIEVHNVRKVFGTHKSMSLKDRAVYRSKKVKTEKGREVLRDINFEVKKGEAVAIIGRNGSGKSTILKLLTKIIRPNEGTIETQGRISCLIELGAGFHPDMSGRENIYINASIFGLDKKETDERLQDILDFSEIEKYIDERVRDYSSGMYMRLAFSIAINVNADILIVDEILSVGDIAYQQKCLEKILQLKKSGVTIVLVTQSPDQARFLCDRTIWLDNGDMKMVGDSKSVCRAYESFMLGTYNLSESIDNEEESEKTDDSNYHNIIAGQQLEDPEVKIASFDIFDTVLIRPCVRPIDLLKLTDLDGYKNSEFRMMRWYADDRAYDKLRAKETMQDIYDSVGSYFNVPSDKLDKAMREELETELEYIRPNEPLKRTYEKALELGKKVIFVSDTYFPREFLEKLLSKNGFGKYDELYCSCELGMRKDDGALFDKVIEDMGVTPQEILHIGNSHRSDYTVPLSKNMRAVHLMTPIDWLRESEYNEFSNYLDPNLDNDILWGIYCNRFTKKNGFTAKMFATPYDFGLFMGPMILGFTQWLIRRSKENGIENLLLCYRDGYMIGKVLLEMSKYVDLGFTFEEIHLPRIMRHPFYSEEAGLFGSLMDMGVDSNMSIGDFIRYRLYVDEDDGSFEEAAKLFTSIGFTDLKLPIGHLTALFPLLNDLDRIYRKSCENIVKNVREYCEYKAGTGPFALFDVGYRGSILTFMKEKIGKDCMEFQMLSHPGTYSNKYPEQLDNYITYPLKQARETMVLEMLIENVISSQEPELTGISMQNGTPEYSFSDVNLFNKSIEQVQNGVMDYVTYAMDILKGKIMDLHFDQTYEIMILSEMLKSPTPEFSEIVRQMNRGDTSQVVGAKIVNPFQQWYDKTVKKGE